VDLNGDADYINLGDVAYTDNITSFSISFWIYLDSKTANQRYVDKWGAGGQRQMIILLYDDADDTRLGFGVRSPLFDNYSLYRTTNGVISTGTWIHIALTWQADHTWVCYINGASVSITSWQTAGSGINTGTSSSPMRLFGDNDGTYFVNGKINDFVFEGGTVWTQNKIDLLYSKVKRNALQIPGIDVYLPFDDFSDGSALSTTANAYKDLSGSGNHGTGIDADGDSLNKAEEVLSYP
jgi:hypothetical protein